MKKSRFIALTTILLFTSNVYAVNECDKYTTSYDQTFCFSKLFVESDKELNTAYKELRALLKPNIKQALTVTQRNWIIYRDNACQPVQGTIDVNCNYQVNRDRTYYLQDRLRECKAGTCRNDMIAKPSWEK